MVRSCLDGSVYVCFLKFVIMNVDDKYTVFRLVKRGDEIAMSLFKRAIGLLVNGVIISDITEACICGILNEEVFQIV